MHPAPVHAITAGSTSSPGQPPHDRQSAAILHERGQTTVMPVGPGDGQAEAWNEAAASMLEEARRTQDTISDALSKRTKDAADLEALQKECDTEIEDLQEQAWRLAMYTELERMRLQLALLHPIDDGEEQEGADGGREPAAGAGCGGAAASGVAPAEPAAGEEQQAVSLAQLDDEIAAVDAQLKAAKQELLDMMGRKTALQEDMADILGSRHAWSAMDADADTDAAPDAHAQHLIKAVRQISVSAAPKAGS